MPPKIVKQTPTSSEEEESTQVVSHNAKLWSPEFQHLAIFICSLGTRVEIDIDGRKTDLFTVEGFNCRGMKYIVQVWGIDAFAVEEYFRANHEKEGQIYKFFPAEKFPNSQLCFRLKAANAYQRRSFEAEFCMNLHVGEGEKINFKKPPKLDIECFPVPMDGWDDVDSYEMEYSLGVDMAPIREPVLPPNLWHTLSGGRITIPPAVLSSPVKKRSYEELCHSPVKIEGGPTFGSSSSSSSVRAPLFANKK